MQKILLAEDEEYVARSYIRKLQVVGYEVVHAHNGEEALTLMKSEKPDLVILDLMMPLKTGFEVLKEVHESGTDEMKAIPIIVASNLGQKSDIDTAHELGARDFLVKSNISLKELVEKVRVYLGPETTP
jgi:two-component system alkaline phosphatase synthesis response regulator PhoP